MTNLADHALAMLAGFLCPVSYALLCPGAHTNAQARMDHSSPTHLVGKLLFFSPGLDLNTPLSVTLVSAPKNIC